MKEELSKVIIETKEDLSEFMDDLKATVKVKEIEKGKGTIEINPELKISIIKWNGYKIQK